MKTQEALSIVTPTYNRGYILGKCYESLKRQTCKSFVWLIVDDGSTDNTRELVQNWISQEQIPIIYVKKENGGKASALNVAFEHINTDYFVCLDSDDTFSSNAVELALRQLDPIKHDNKYCGILALRTTPNGNVLGGKEIPADVTEITRSELSNKLKIKSELICFYKSSIVTKYRFPEIEGEKFISPAYLEYELSRKYKYLVSHSVFCYCEYLPDGLTRNKREVIRKNPKGYTLVKRQSFEFANNFQAKSKHCIMYICGCILSREKRCIRNSPNKIMSLIYYPAGWLVYLLRFR